MLARISMALGMALFTYGCSTEGCDRGGCDKMTTAASGISTGIAGAVASQSDLVSNGCQECPFAEARIEIWKVDSPVTPEVDVALVARTQPIATMNAAPFYRKTLDPGTYVVCADRQCVEETVESGQVTTVNIMRLNGPTRFWTANGSGAFGEVTGINQPAPGF